jgi:prolyl-tRNA synthetase
MKYSQQLIPTTRNVPKDATMVSHILLVRGGFIRLLSKGIYTFLPLGWKVVRNVADVVREEMNRAGALEMLMPFVHPAEIWRESQRWETFGPELLKFKNREGAEYCLGPTHEEVITDVARRELKSYRQLPMNLYQIQTKYRDEPRPRAGLLRCREFLMKDAYSFDVNEQAARRSYGRMLVAYARIMARLGLSFCVVRAGTGSIGGDLSHEFQAVTPNGEDTLVLCDGCGYAVNVEIAPAYPARKPAGPPPAAPDAPGAAVVDTPNVRTVEELSAFLSVDRKRVIKTIIVVFEDKAVAALVRGDRELNLMKLGRLVGAKDLFLAGDEEVQRITGAPVGFAGPVGLSIPVYADIEVMAVEDGVCGANQADRHIVHIHPARDIAPAAWADLRRVEDGDACPECGAPLRTEKGIEGGQTFYLGTIYSARMNATFIDQDGTSRPFDMGCYGIGVTRLAAAVVEQMNDERGIIWPVSVAPFHVIVVPLGADPGLMETARQIAGPLEASGRAVLLDDRDESPGVKFYDADLVGVPVQVIVGPKGMKEGKVEVRLRDRSRQAMVPSGDAVAHVTAVLAEMEAALEAKAKAWEERIFKVAKM